MENNVLVDFQVVRLLCSRLCHDLAGPAGAVHNGVELLTESGAHGDDALGLVATSVERMNARLGFYRLAFGLGGPGGRKPALEEARDLATGFLSGARTTLDWPDFPAPQVLRERLDDAVKLLLNMVLFGADSLPRGGALEIRFALTSDSPAAIGLAVRALGRGAFVRDDRMAALSYDGVNEGLNAHNVHGFFMQRLAQCAGSWIEVTGGADEVQIAAFLQN